MEELTRTEERVMQQFWKLKKAFVKDVIQALPDDPKPPYNTISSVVRLLEKKGFLGYKAYGKTYEYFLNCLSVLQFAIDVLRVKHIIICGHYGCSGVNAALVRGRIGLADNWLRHVQDVHTKHERYLGEVQPSGAKLDRLCELNVIEQVANLCQTTIVEDAWDRGQELVIHSWIYGLRDGLLRDLGMNIDGPGQLADKMQNAFARYEKHED